MHDCPVFFKGPVRDNCQHICLKHQLKTGKFPDRRQTERQEESKYLEGKSANTHTSKAITLDQNRQTSTTLSKLISRIKSIEILSIKKHHLDDHLLKTDYVRDELNTSSRLKEDKTIVCSVEPPKSQRPLLQDCNNPEILFEQTETKENEDLRKETSEDRYKAQELSADVETGEEQALDPCDDICEQRSISVLLKRVEVARPHIPRSYSSLSQYPTNEYIPHRRAHSSLARPK
uniref:Uncharacterized protein n=1 Tax=Timema shepardi TaxID=629360 RepID=A0A7R9B9X3_TIMSH|nr:unnamed protein product [Timema shepardi]